MINPFGLLPDSGDKMVNIRVLQKVQSEIELKSKFILGQDLH